VHLRASVTAAALTLALGCALAACAGGAEEGPAAAAIAFSVFQLPGDEGCGGGIWTVDGPDARPRLVVGPNDSVEPLYPRFTPDGRSLFFADFVDPTDLPVLDVYRLAGDSGRASQVFGGAIAFLYRWAENAPVLATAREDGEVVAVDGTTGDVTELGRADGPDYALDPRGERIAFSRGSSLWVQDVAGDPPRRIAPDGRGPAWSRDGSRIAFLRGTPGEAAASLLVVPADGGSPRQLVADALVGRLLWTEDEVLYLRPPAAGADGQEHGVGDLRAVDVSSGKTRPVADEVLPLEVSADGQRLLFLRPHIVDGELAFSVRTMDLDGTGEQVLAVVDEEDVNIGSVPTWQRQPRRVADASGPYAPPQERAARCGEAIERWRDRLAGD
jgi:hypothetical protein